MDRHLIVGIDPGLTGGISFYDTVSHAIVGVADMPCTRNFKSGKNELGIYELGRVFGERSEEISLAVVEEVHSFPGQGVRSMFTFGKVFGCILGALAAHKIQILLVRPEVWKLSLGLSRNKKDSINLAKKLFPSDKGLWDGKDGRAESALIAYFAAKNLKKMDRVN